MHGSGPLHLNPHSLRTSGSIRSAVPIPRVSEDGAALEARPGGAKRAIGSLTEAVFARHQRSGHGQDPGPGRAGSRKAAAGEIVRQTWRIADALLWHCQAAESFKRKS